MSEKEYHRPLNIPLAMLREMACRSIDNPEPDGSTSVGGFNQAVNEVDLELLATEMVETLLEPRNAEWISPRLLEVAGMWKKRLDRATKLPTQDLCKWCGKTYDEHNADETLVTPRMPCCGLKAHFLSDRT